MTEALPRCASGFWVVMMFLSIPSLSGQEFTIHHAGTWPDYLTGQAHQITYREGFVYVQVDVSGGGWGTLPGRRLADEVVAIFDAHTPERPVRVGNVGGLNLGAPYFFGNYAVPIGGDLGLRIFDFTNPTNPVPLPFSATSIIPGGVSGFVMSGGIGYATTYYGPLYVLDLSDVRNPRNLKMVEFGFYQPLGSLAIVSGRTLCVAAGSDRFGQGAGVIFLDISAPANPVKVGSYLRPESYGGILASGSRLVARTPGGTVDIINAANPASSALLGTYTNSWVGTMRIDGNLLFAGGNAGDIRALDISLPSHIVEMGRYTNGATLWSFAKNERFLYTMGGRAAMKVIDTSQPTNTASPTTFEPAAPMKVKVTTVDGRAYIAEASAGLQIVDVSHPSDPRPLGGSRDCRNAMGCAVTNGLAYVADNTNGLVILDVSNPTNVVQVGQLANSSNAISANHVVVSGNYAYVRNAGLDIIDVSNPRQPIRTAHWSNNSYSPVYDSLTVDGSHVYFPSSQGLQIIDVANPSNPILRGTFTTNFGSLPTHVSVVGRTAYLLAADMWMLDVGDPANPTLLSRFSDGLNSFLQLFVSGRYALATLCRGNDCEFTVFDLIDPLLPRPVVRQTGMADGLSLAVEGHYAWVCNGDGGLSAFALNPPGPPTSARLTAAPSNSVLQLEVRGQPMRTHVVQTTTSIELPDAWQDLAAESPADGIFSIEVPMDAPPRRYFRALSE